MKKWCVAKGHCVWKQGGSALFSTLFLPVGEDWTGVGEGQRKEVADPKRTS